MKKPVAPAGRCAVVFHSADHGLIAAALVKHCEGQGLKVYQSQETGEAVQAVFAQVRADSMRPVLVVHGGGHRKPQAAMACSSQDIESQWHSVCFTGSLVGQAAIRAMVPAGQGTLLYLGHLSATQSLPGAAAHGAAHAGLRSFAQSMAREFGPKGIHVAHLVLGGDMAGTHAPAAAAVAEACWQLHRQHPSTWTHELDLRAVQDQG
jgi:NAD(P)-dependent dehydrogenase (short-subunit alcohol dehydrogenase family)